MIPKRKTKMGYNATCAFDFPLLLEIEPSYGTLWKLFLTSWAREN